MLKNIIAVAILSSLILIVLLAVIHYVITPVTPVIIAGAIGGLSSSLVFNAFYNKDDRR